METLDCLQDYLEQYEKLIDEFDVVVKSYNKLSLDEAVDSQKDFNTDKLIELHESVGVGVVGWVKIANDLSYSISQFEKKGIDVPKKYVIYKMHEVILAAKTLLHAIEISLTNRGITGYEPEEE